MDGICQERHIVQHFMNYFLEKKPISSDKRMMILGYHHSNSPTRSSFIHIHSIGENLRQLAYSGKYKKRRIFSGVESSPLGEEAFEVWRDSALTIVADWPGSGPVLCRKIQENLRGPALDLIKLHREVCLQDGPEKLIELLEDTYGPVEDEIEMLYKFQSCIQKDKESLSEYLKRLQQMLKLLVCRRIIATDCVDSMRLLQLFQGASSMDPTAVMLRS
ncbi:hypothetical protein XELAEV_18041020mg [Xenopus laevis]|uniref:Paraneoplastic antigen Ma-like C-terminal domain-containing protein n=1 Tax=Xenopus laevis TaxID=8355 RepID=A0A974C1M3_XENLA|nr:hypothetical protein XELAEV_18041020mg [Xenopus laevis]